MIKPITIYTAICDGCGTDICDGTDWSGWCMDGIENELSEQDWEVLNTHDEIYNELKEITGFKKVTNHYCPKCYSYDDNDNLILKEKT